MAPVLLVRQPSGYEAERRYVAEVVLTEFLGLDIAVQTEEREDVAITLADGSASTVLSVSDVLFTTPRTDWLTERALPGLPLRTLDLTKTTLAPPAFDDPIPVLYARPDRPGSLIEVDDAGLRLGVDVFGGAFLLLTRYEELALDERDEHGRFPAGASLAERAGFLQRPLVNEYVELLWSALSSLWPRLSRRERRFSILPSHDVDFPSIEPVRGEAGERALRELRRERAPVVAVRRLLAPAIGSDLYDTFDLIMRMSEKRSLRSSFNFIPVNTAGAIDGAYTLDDPNIRRLLTAIAERGHEIGFHPGYATFDDPERTRQDFLRLRAVCDELGIDQPKWGGRQHYLRWRNPTTWQNWDDAGLDYDSTLSFASRAGFRCGVCYEYPVFNLLTSERLRLRERPLVVMDASLLSYQRLSPDQAGEHIEKLKEKCRRVNGQFTLLWHNDRLLSRRARQAYARAIS
ncbi:MAG: polysaccharide deacetylase family protein [Gaiellaceae bacterium]